jgi:hypothetical protein
MNKGKVLVLFLANTQSTGCFVSFSRRVDDGAQQPSNLFPEEKCTFLLFSAL